jgi:hypothetical protein
MNSALAATTGLNVAHIEPVDFGRGWFHVKLRRKVGEATSDRPLWFLNNDDAQRNRVLIDMWAHEHCQGKWVIENSGVVFQNEEDAILFTVALGQS